MAKDTKGPKKQKKVTQPTTKKAAKKAAPKKQNLSALKKGELIIPETVFKTMAFTIVGTSELVTHAFGPRAIQKMREDQERTGPKSRKKDPRNFELDYNDAKHISTEGWLGLPATAFKSSIVEGGVLLGITMTGLRRTVFVETDGVSTTGVQLVRVYGKEDMVIHPVRLASGVASLAARPMWHEWKARLRITFDATCLEPVHLLRLVQRAARQIGVGEGRPSSKQSVGMGWGTFRLDGDVMVFDSPTDDPGDDSLVPWEASQLAGEAEEVAA